MTLLKNSDLSALNKNYANAEEFPHITIDNFLTEDTAEKIHVAFPRIADEGWIHYFHINEKKFGLNKWDKFPETIRSAIEQLNSPEFIKILQKITGISGLIADPDLEGGGVHQITRGGFLNIHADFTAHPHHENWRRRVNVLIYFNKEWEEDYGGHLELWSKDMKQCFEKVLPIFNRCVIFSTDMDSYHGHPTPLNCPEDFTRKSIALYYFTEEKNPIKRATNYQSRPEDSISKGILIFLDKKLLSGYNWLKGKLGINDDLVSAILKSLSSKNKK